MVTTIPQRDLRNHNAQIIERVIAGESFTVTRDGVPVADVTPHRLDVGRPLVLRVEDIDRWPRLSSEAAAEWTADIRAMDEFLDQRPRDPWER